MEQGIIKDGFYVQGDLKFAIDPKDAHKTFDMVAALSQPDKIKLAKLNDIKTEPYNKQLLTTILKSVVQNAWFVATKGSLPTEVFTAHQGRLQRYAVELAIPTSTVDFLSKKTRATKQARPSLMYLIDEAKYEADHKNWRGQRYLVVKSMGELQKEPHEAGTGFSVRAIFDNAKETRETPAPTRNAVGQIVNALVEAGIAKLLNPQDARTKAAPKAKTTTTPPATHGKKKH